MKGQAGLRLGHLMLGWGSVGVAYLVGSTRAAEAWQLPAHPYEASIPYIEAAVWPYVSFYLIIPLAFAATPRWRVRWLSHAFQWCALAAGAVFICWPTTVPAVALPSGTDLTSIVLRGLVAFDTPANCLPSLHAALTVLCAWALCSPRRPLRTALVLAWAAVICWSVVALRRHGGYDLLAGIALGLMAGALTQQRSAR